MVETKAIEHMFPMGERLKQGVQKQAKSLDLKINYTGPVTIPFMTIAEDPPLEKAKTFCTRAYEQGIFFHPSHTWSLSAAHGEPGLEQTLMATLRAFEEVKERFG